jgi:hypothetical protein
MNCNSLDNEIRETFYNTMICVAIENNVNATELNGLNRVQLLSQIIVLTLVIICETSKIGFYTIKQTHITIDNVPEYFKQLYVSLEKIKKINDKELQKKHLMELTVVIMNKNMFNSIMCDVINFYKNISENINNECDNNDDNSRNCENFNRYIRDPSSNNMVENIRQTFYDTMMIAIQYDNDIIKNEDVLSFEPYIAIGMPSLSIIYNIMNSMDTDGIRLISGHVITKNNCPIYPQLFDKLFYVKNQIKIKNLSDEEFILLKYKCINNPDLEIPQILINFDSIKLNIIVGNITDIAIDVSRLYNFKRNMLNIIK